MAAPWTAKKIAEMHRLAGEGLSASKIAAKLGVTKNAIIGKMHRGGSTLVRKPGGVLSEDKRPPRPKRMVAIRPAPVLGPCTIANLTDYRCHWPIGDSLTESFRYCGAAKPLIGPYCTLHADAARGKPTGHKSVSVANFRGKLKISGAYK